MIVHSAQTIETRRSAFGTSVVTPAEQLYVRNNLPPPDASIVANRDAWSVADRRRAQPAGADGRRPEDDGRGDGRHGAAVLRQRAQLLPEQAERHALDGRRRRLRHLERRAGPLCRRSARRCRARHALPHRHRRREDSRRRRSAVGHGRALGGDRRHERRAAGVGDERRAALARARRSAAPGRAGLQRRQQRQVREAGGVHRSRVAGQDHEHRLPDDGARPARRRRPIPRSRSSTSSRS